MSRATFKPLLIAATLALTLATSPARGYEEAVHALLDERAYPAELLDTPLTAATPADEDSLRRAIWRAGATHPDGDLRRRFIGRYPTADGFDAWAFKDFLGLDPDVPIFGIDELPALPSPTTLRALLPLAAREPDDDRRNQNRFAHDRTRQVRKDRFGRPLPADPTQLDMSPLTGDASQGYAHYGLPKLQFSDDPDVLKSDPRRWAYPPTAHAYAAEFAQLHTDLAICAASMGTEGGLYLGWLFLGNSHHYLQDVANQIHTLQAIYGFFYDAKIESYKEDLKSLGGLLRSRPDFVSIGIQIISNHHLLAENLWSKRVQAAVAGKPSAPEVEEGLANITRGNSDLEKALDGRNLTLADEWGAIITDEVIEASSREGGPVYEAIRELAVRSLSRVGGVYDGKEDPDLYLRQDADPAILTRFYRLQATSFGRAGSALRRDVALFQSILAEGKDGIEARTARFNASAWRLVKTQLAALEARENRLAHFVPRPPEKETINWLVPGGLVVVLFIFVAVPVLIVRRVVRRRRARLAPDPSGYSLRRVARMARGLVAGERGHPGDGEVGLEAHHGLAAKALHAAEILDLGERAVTLAPGHDRGGLARADAGKALEILFRRGVEVDLAGERRGLLGIHFRAQAAGGRDARRRHRRRRGVRGGPRGQGQDGGANERHQTRKLRSLHVLLL